MNTKTIRIVNREKGQGTVEFALEFPILLLLIIGVVEAGWFMFFVNSVSIASREAARYGAAIGNSVYPDGTTIPRYRDCQGIRNAAKRLGSFANIQDSNITITFIRTNGSSTVCSSSVSVVMGDKIHVEVTGNYQPLVNIISLPAFPFTVKSEYSVMKDIQVSPY